MVTSAADFGDLQTKPNQTTHIYPYILYLFDNPTPRTMLWRPLQLIWVTSAADHGDLCSWSWWPLNMTSNGGNPNNLYLPLHVIPFWKCHTKDITMVTSAADFSDLQTKQCIFTPTYYTLYLLKEFIWVFIVSTFGSQNQHKSSQSESDYRGGYLLGRQKILPKIWSI